MTKPGRPLDYNDFRSGLTFGAIRDELTAEQDAAYNRGEFMAVTRHTVLGRWRQRKIEAWEHYRQQQKDENVKFLINPGKSRANKGGRTMAKRRTPPRHKSGPKKGQFMSRRARSAKRNPAKRRAAPKAAARRRAPAARKRAPAKRRTYRRNPARRDLVSQLTGGIIEAGQILVGKAAVRSVPDMLKLPKEGNVGLAVQVGVALGLGFVSEMFMSRAAAQAILAGGLTAPLETLIVSYQVPWLSTALSPTTGAAGVGSYVQSRGVGGYVMPSAPVMPAIAASNRLGQYSHQYGAADMYGYPN